MSENARTRKALLWLTMATALLYISILGGGIYLYFTGSKAEQVNQTTDRLNQTIGAFCEVTSAPDAEEPKAIHDLAEKTLVLSSQDCEAIVRYLEENP